MLLTLAVQSCFFAAAIFVASSHIARYTKVLPSFSFPAQCYCLVDSLHVLDISDVGDLHNIFSPIILLFFIEFTALFIVGFTVCAFYFRTSMANV